MTRRLFAALLLATPLFAACGTEVMEFPLPDGGGGACFINGTPVTSGSTSPSDACQTCQPAVSTTAYKTAPDGTSCGAGLTCHSGACF